MRHRGVLQRHRAIEHHGAAARVDDHLGRHFAGADIQSLQTRHEVDPTIGIAWCIQQDQPAILGAGHGATEGVVDRRDHPLRHAEVRLLELQLEHAALVAELQRHLALDRGAAADPPAGLLVDLHAAATGLGPGAANQQVALGQRIGFAIGALERGHQQGAAAQAAGIADRGHHHIQSLPRPDESRQLRGDHHRGDVAQLHVGARRHGDAQLRQHVGQALAGERCLHGLVAGAIQAHHQAVADQGVAAHAGKFSQIAQALDLSSTGAAQAKQ
ncbi:hypothetical protein D9M71_467870 [compost metagenome]